MGNNNAKEKEDKKKKEEEEESEKKKTEGRVNTIWKLEDFKSEDNPFKIIPQCNDTTPRNLLMGEKPKRENKIKEPTEYVEPSDEFDIDGDNWRNRQLLGNIYDTRSGVLSINGNIRKCDACMEYEGMTYFHCFKCDDYDLCKDCYEQGKGVHLHDDNTTDYFHLMNESPNSSRYTISEEPNSVSAMMLAFKIYSERYFLGTRESLKDHMTWLRFKDVKLKMERYVRAMILRGYFNPKEFFGLLAKTSIQWIISDFSCFYCGMISVPVHYTMNYEEKKYIVELTKCRYLLVSHEFLEESKRLMEECETLEVVIVSDLDEHPDEQNNIFSFSKLEEEGEAGESKLEVTAYKDLKDEDTVSVVFTSGTTSRPKGVVLTEKTWRKRDSRMDVFPVVEVLFGTPSHMSPRVIILHVLLHGGRLSILTQNDMKNLFEDFKYVAPTYISLPPRILEFIYDHFNFEVKKKLMVMKQETEKNNEEEGEIEEKEGATDLSEETVKKVQFETFMELRKNRADFFGDKLAIISTGGAPTSTKVKRFIRMVFDCPVYEGYGISEVGSVMYNGFRRREMKLADVPSLGYFTTDKPYPRGEICVKDDGTINRYFLDEGKNRRIDSEGWYHTGDIAMLANADFILIDRISNIIKLSNGEFFSIERVEKVMKEKCDEIERIVVFPNKLRTKLFALVKLFKKKEKEGGRTVGKGKVLLEKMVERGCSGDDRLKKWQIPSKVILIEEDFTVENKMLTISEKMNRRKILEYYKDRIEKELGEGDVNDVKEWVSSMISMEDWKKKDEDMTVGEFGLDSLSAVRFINEAKKIFHKNLTFRELMNSSLSSLVEKFSSGDDDNQNQEARGVGHRMIRFEEEFKSDRMKKLVGEMEEYLQIISKKESEEDEDEGEEVVVVEEKERTRSSQLQLKKIFLTGCTGFVGSHLLTELLKLPSIQKVYCLVRKGSEKKEYHEKKVEYVTGDLAEEKLGMAEERFNMLRDEEELDAIIHCGAYVNHFLGYEDLFDVNVRSTFDIFKLAVRMKGKRSYCVPIHYISSLSVFSDYSKRVLLQSHDSSNGYACTKFISDCLFQRFMEMYSSDSLVLDISIHRLNLVGFSKIRGSRNEKDWFNIFVDLLVNSRLGCSMKHDDVPMNMHSVDFVASNIINCASKSSKRKLRQINYTMKNLSVSEFIENVLLYLKNSKVTYQNFDSFEEWIGEVSRYIDGLEESVEKRKFRTFLNIWRRRKRIGNLFWNDVVKRDEEEVTGGENDEKYSYEDIKKMLDVLGEEERE